MKWIYLLTAILSEVIATSALNESQGFTKLAPSLVAAIGYCSAFYFLSLTLKTVSMGVAYAIWAGIGIVAISAVGYFRFGQKLDFPAFLGITLITTGVMVINIFSKSIGHS